MALHRTRKCDKFNLKFLGSILAGAVQLVRKETHSDNVMNGTPEGTFLFQYLPEKKSKQKN